MTKPLQLATMAIVLLLVSCGTPPTPVALPTPEQPTIAQAPTVTASQRAQLQTIATQAQAMATAAQALQQMGQAIRADTVWRGKVKAAASIVTGGYKTISAIELPSFLSPLAARTTKAIDACNTIAAPLAKNATTITVQDLSSKDAALATCVRDLDRLRLSISGVP